MTAVAVAAVPPGDGGTATAPLGDDDDAGGAEPFAAAAAVPAVTGDALAVPDAPAGGLAAEGRTGAGAVMKPDGGAFNDRIAGAVAGEPAVPGGEAVAGPFAGRAERDSGRVAAGAGGAGTAAAGLSAVASGGAV
jgi:hypothetical protein